MNQAEMVAVLRVEGWRGGTPQLNDDYVLRLYRHFETPTRCACNMDKAGIQVECAVWEFPDGRGARPQIDLMAETPDGKWPHISMSCDDLEDVRKQIPRLLATWEFIAHAPAMEVIDGE